MAGETGTRKKDNSQSIVKRNLRALRKINTSIEFMLLYGILEKMEERVTTLERENSLYRRLS